jgi:hypothetical protein
MARAREWLATGAGAEGRGKAGGFVMQVSLTLLLVLPLLALPAPPCHGALAGKVWKGDLPQPRVRRTGTGGRR